MATTDVSAHRAATDAERSNHTLDQLCVNTIRTLAMDAVQQANSGHPGTPMALAPMVYCLWQRFLRFDPSHPIWHNRDRFVLSVGHASMLLYSMLHLTGVKAVKGLIPIDREALGAPDLYGRDRIFVYLRLQTAPDATQDTSVEALERAGHPVVRIALDDPYDLGEEFFRWEFATAVAGSILGINPFDQPDVEASKIATRKLTDAYEKNGALPAETPIFTGDGIMLFTDERNAADLAKMLKGNHTLEGYLEAHLSRLRPGDYFALLAYIEMNEAHEKVLQAMRHGVRDVRHIATCLEFGPRFLHSTGQAYKGGPNTGLFLQITCDDAFDLAVPGQKYTFGVVKGAQARGDFEVLLERKRRALRAHLGADVAAHLATLQAAFVSALRSRATSSPDLASLRRT